VGSEKRSGLRSGRHKIRRSGSAAPNPADRRLHFDRLRRPQYYTLQDNLISTLLSSVQAAENTAAREHKDWCYAERKSQAVKLKARIAAFEAHFATAMATLKQVFDAKNLSDSDKLASLELLLFPVDDAPCSPTRFCAA